MEKNPVVKGNVQKELELITPTVTDLQQLAELRASAFQEKRCWFCGQTFSHFQEQTSQHMHQLTNHMEKLSHCRIVKDSENRILGGIQLQLQGDVGDLSMPSDIRHVCKEGECYVEWIGCHAEARGKGIGSRLLQWANHFAREKGCHQISLTVMQKNKGALSLYKRKGYVVQPNNDPCDVLCSCCVVFCFMGCKYFKPLDMIRPLTDHDLQ